MRHKAHLFYGGERGIRTPGTLRHNGFQDRRFKPLTHLSANGNNLENVFESRQIFIKLAIFVLLFPKKD